MVDKTITEVKAMIDAFANGEKSKRPVAIFPHQDGTCKTILDFLRNNAQYKELTRSTAVSNKDEGTVFFANINLIPRNKEIFLSWLSEFTKTASACGRQLLVVFDDWRGNRTDEMRPDIEKALNWIKESQLKFDIYNCEAHVFDSNGRAID